MTENYFGETGDNPEKRRFRELVELTAQKLITSPVVEVLPVDYPELQSEPIPHLYQAHVAEEAFARALDELAPPDSLPQLHETLVEAPTLQYVEPRVIDDQTFELIPRSIFLSYSTRSDVQEYEHDVYVYINDETSHVVDEYSRNGLVIGLDELRYDRSDETEVFEDTIAHHLAQQRPLEPRDYELIRVALDNLVANPDLA